MSVTRRRYFFLNTADIEQIVYALASELYPDYPDPMPAFQYLGGDHGKGLLESALAQARQQFGGRFLYRTVYDKGAALFRSIIKNHPLLDGNKRLALTALTVFLTANGVMFRVPKDEAVDFALRVAAGAPDVPLKEVSWWLRQNSLNLYGIRTMSTSNYDRWSLRHFSAISEADRESLLDIMKAYATFQGRLAGVFRRLPG